MSNCIAYEGERIPWYNGTGSAVVVDEPVVVGNLGIGVALDAIASTATGTVQLCGVVKFIKPTTSGNTFSQGDPVYITVGSGTATAADKDAATGLYFAGFAAEPAVQGDTTVKCRLAPFADEGTRYLTAADTVTLAVADFKSKRLVLTVSKNGTATVNLPAVASTALGASLTMKKTGTAGAITIDGSDSETIDGATTHATCDAQYDVITIVNTGAAWVIQSSNIA